MKIKTSECLKKTILSGIIIFFFLDLCAQKHNPNEIITLLNSSRDNNRNTEPCWSPDGKQIAFMSLRDGNAEIYIMNSDGSSQTNLTNHPDGDGEPQWSPDGSKLLWSSNRNGPGRVFVIDIETRESIELTHTGVLELTPAWSPDGKKIALASTLAKNTLIFIVNADGSDNRQATRSAANLSRPVWSPDGTKISCQAIGAGTFGSIIINLADNSNSPASKKTGWVDHIGWSTDGSKSFFSSSALNPSGKRVSKIFYIDNLTGKITVVAKNINNLIETEISPDGNRILYREDDKILVKDFKQKRPIIIGNDFHSARWSPDGKKIVMVSASAENIFTINSDGTDLKQLTY